MTTQPKALELADMLDDANDFYPESSNSFNNKLADSCGDAADELRRLHEENEKLRVDAECFRFWVREAALNPSGIAKLIMYCTTEEEYRAAIIPCIEQSKAILSKAKGGTNV